MVKVITYCDHCGKVLNSMDDYGGSEIEIAYVELEADLCKECHEQLVKTVKEFCSQIERGNIVIGDCVTHWMPHPEPPKEDA